MEKLEQDGRNCSENLRKKQDRIDALNNKLEETNKLASNYKKELETHNEHNLKQDILDYNREILELRKVITNLEEEKNTLEQKLEENCGVSK